MSEQSRRIDLRFGDLAISAQGFENPVQTVKQVLRFVQRLVEETPEMAGTGFVLDEARMDALMAELAQRLQVPAERLQVTPGLVVVALDGAHGLAAGEDAAAVAAPAGTVTVADAGAEAATGPVSAADPHAGEDAILPGAGAPALDDESPDTPAAPLTADWTDWPDAVETGAPDWPGEDSAAGTGGEEPEPAEGLAGAGPAPVPGAGPMLPETDAAEDPGAETAETHPDAPVPAAPRPSSLAPRDLPGPLAFLRMAEQEREAEAAAAGEADGEDAAGAGPVADGSGGDRHGTPVAADAAEADADARDPGPAEPEAPAAGDAVEPDTGAAPAWAGLWRGTGSAPGTPQTATPAPAWATPETAAAAPSPDTDALPGEAETGPVDIFAAPAPDDSPDDGTGALAAPPETEAETEAEADDAPDAPGLAAAPGKDEEAQAPHAPPPGDGAPAAAEPTAEPGAEPLPEPASLAARAAPDRQAEATDWPAPAEPEAEPAPASIFAAPSAPEPARGSIFDAPQEPEPPAERVDIFAAPREAPPVNIFGGPAADPEPRRAPPEPPAGPVNIFGGPAAAEPAPPRGPRWIADPNEPAPPLRLDRFAAPDPASGGRGALPDETVIGSAMGEALAGGGGARPGGRIGPAELADRANASTVPELLAVAAAWLTLVDQRSRFGRREVMEIFDQLPGDHPRSLEARIKGYGKLVRNGSLVLVDDGLFALGPEERERFRELIG